MPAICRSSRRLVLALRLFALFLIALHLAAPLFQESWAWGLWPATCLPVGWRWGLAALAALLVLGGDAIAARLGRLAHLADSPDRAGPAASWLRVALPVLALVPFYLFRIVHTRWGDAYILVMSIPHPQVRLTYTWQAPLDVFIHAKTWALGHQLFGWPDAMPAYAIWSPIGGAVFLWILIGLAFWLGRDRTERLIVIGLMATLGTMELFFGYMENYTLVTVGILAFAWLALRALRGETPLFWAAAVLAITHAVNPASVFLAPSLLYVAWHAPVAWPGDAPRAIGARPGWRALAALAVPYVIVFLGVLAFMTAGGHGLSSLMGDQAPGGADRNWFVPLFHTGTRWEHYTMFSVGHLLDVLNEQILTAPAVWPAVILAAILAWRLLPRRDKEYRFLLLYAGLFLLLILTWNADLGGQRDWDLFSLAAIPAAVLLGYVLPRVLPERKALAQAGWALIAMQAFHTAGWIYQNTLPWTWPKS